MRPTAPVIVGVDQISSRTAHVSWRLTNNTADQSADQFMLRLLFSNQSLADLIYLPGSVNQTSLDGLVPATEYSLLLLAVNSDGEVSTNPVTFQTLQGRPAVSHLEVNRLNRTGFSMRIELAYTGGGEIIGLDGIYRTTTHPTEHTIGRLEPESSGLRVTAIFNLADPSVDVAGELEFVFQVYNQYEFSSLPYTHRGKHTD